MKTPTTFLGMALLSALPLLAQRPPVELGIDRLVASSFKLLEGQRIGLVSNFTGRDGQGRTTVEILHAAKSVQLLALFSPEHGFAGRLEGHLLTVHLLGYKNRSGNMGC